ncbi:chaperonin 10-like protein [Leptodontidium sp. 2 PMI_412]|nr:chaperonin 10-like protein [Leptodontidium sp. 2 PMI_412]
MANQAAWLDGVGHTFRVGPADMPNIDANEVIIKNHSIAINPIDWKPMVLGCDAAGVVVDVGSDVHHVKKGDRVIGHAVSLMSQKPKNDAFQRYVAVEAAKVAKIPDSLSFNDACVVPLALDTAATGLFSDRDQGYLGLELPTLPAKTSDKKLIIYGGSSSVGTLGIQLAAATGAYVVAVASPKNFDFCRSCGAHEVFDYNDPAVVDHVVQAVKAAKPTDFVGILDAISQKGSFKIVVPMLEKLGSGNLATVLAGPSNIPSASKTNYIEGINNIVDPLWADLIAPALEQGKLKCLPESYVIGRGLGSVEKGCLANKKSVSAKKLVIELEEKRIIHVFPQTGTIPITSYMVEQVRISRLCFLH